MMLCWRTRSFCFGKALAFVLRAWAAQIEAAERPNILLVLSDDQSAAHVERELKAALQEWMILRRDFLSLPVSPPPPAKPRAQR